MSAETMDAIDNTFRVKPKPRPTGDSKDDLQFMCNMYRQLAVHYRIITVSEDWEKYFGKDNWKEIQRILRENPEQ